MRITQKINLFSFLLLTIPTISISQEYWSGEKYDITISLGTNIGGTSPIPIPETVNTIKSWRAGLNPSFEINTTYWLPKSQNWGVNTGLILEYKGMEAVADVRNFPVELIQENMRIQGIFRGENKTKVRNGYISIPLQAAYRTNGRFNFRLGGYISYTGERSFIGMASNGNLRKDLNSTKLEIIENTYDFSENIRAIDTGLLMSGEIYVRKNMSAKLGLSWGLLPIFKSNFKGVGYNLYNIYMNTAISYRL